MKGTPMKYSVDSAEVAHAAARTRASASALHSEVAAMMAHLLALQGSWTGSASLAFGDLAHHWRMTQQQVESMLEQISLALDTAATAYADAEAANARMFAL
ncbi:MAG: WXG100 family type VII secretion target [Actinomycetes bacterium]|nr:WXG100 family type VII secretion target [Actinomycetes bacterium]MDX5380820.1 WXG100 family type VII secretion target [Actinomycetes bacterium]MDX5399872.1 WXG100 family type VII secretion target [Actinomycetes bacterium]MDX5450567.1 WXG100 family type VII secretion target [Actinomycetes bacterium]